jgi:ribosome-associated toxin RatA of RatAB toxin-antitoxin module
VRTVDAVTVRADLACVFALAADVERWPTFLPHYRWVRVLERGAATRTVEMAAWRPFGPLRYPTWWVSEMRVEAPHAVRYRHVRGITRGMDVEWRLAAEPDGVRVTIVHEWAGPSWPVIGGVAAGWVIGPVFVHGIAQRTLAGVKQHAEGS